ncbi:nitroreductase family protein [Siculibacillus lacustris]|uniref:Nitroreductase family protein n=2 Tax=Siculibacillus lacustris TaxID=1549641 RepID=A0A4Q9VE31_9HYPH|nr:nitroreductase family protein [Siculibacillus lacustris]
MKSAIKKYIPDFVWRRLRKARVFVETIYVLIRDYAYDFGKFYKYSSAVRVRPDLESKIKTIIKEYHVIEKGLSLPEPRAGFGRDVVERVIGETTRFEAEHGSHAFTVAVRDALAEYVAFNRDHDLRFPAIEAFLAGGPAGSADSTGGTLSFARDDIVRHGDFSFADFAARRHSIRNFTGDEVPEADLLRAVEISLKTPSVCNRQTAKAYILRGKELIAKGLSYQNGNRGFGHRAGAVYIVTSDLRSFLYTGERNQAWIDGGLFAMSLAYAVHSLGYGACMLNWSVDFDRDRAMKRNLGIPDNEAAIMMIAVGVIPSELKVAQSWRKTLQETAIVLG